MNVWNILFKKDQNKNEDQIKINGLYELNQKMGFLSVRHKVIIKKVVKDDIEVLFIEKDSSGINVNGFWKEGNIYEVDIKSIGRYLGSRDDFPEYFV